MFAKDKDLAKRHSFDVDGMARPQSMLSAQKIEKMLPSIDRNIGPTSRSSRKIAIKNFDKVTKSPLEGPVLKSDYHDTHRSNR